MLPVAGTNCWSWPEFFLRRMRKKAARPMMARPRRGPTTAPAIQALLFFLPLELTSVSTSEERRVGFGAVVIVGVADARPGEGRAPMDVIAPGLVVSLGYVISKGGCTYWMRWRWRLMGLNGSSSSLLKIHRIQC